MTNPLIEEFGNLLVWHVRDAAIRSGDRMLDRNAHNPVAHRWRKALSARKPGEIAAVVIPDCVDETIFYLLQAVDQGLLRICFVSDGDTVDLAEEGHGELSGWYMGSDGWRSRYTHERYSDDVEDLGEPWRDSSPSCPE
jgi:hypothetical protein